MTLKEKRAAELKAARDIVEAARAAVRSLTADEQAKADEHLAEVERLDAQIKAAEVDQARLARLSALTPGAKAPGAADDSKGDDRPATSLGEHFVKSVAPRIDSFKGVKGASISAPEWLGLKVATDTQVESGSVWGSITTQIDPTIVQGVRVRPVIADLLAPGTLSGATTGVTYFVEGAMEGAFTTVAEGGAKPQIHFADPTTRTDNLKKIAGFLKFSDEMLDDLAYVATELNNRGIFALQKFEEAQLLSGDGTGTNLLGLLNRSGIQAYGAGTNTKASNPDTLFHARSLVSTGSGEDADGIVINPADYEALRLMKDANTQYYGGGFFTGQYGVGGILSDPPLWGLRTIVTPAITAGTVLVGAFRAAATVYRKGGLRVESTNSHASDFTSNLVTTRIEERVALAVRKPAALVKVTLGTT